MSQTDAIQRFRQALTDDQRLASTFREAFPELAAALLDRSGELSSKDLARVANLGGPNDLS